MSDKQMIKDLRKKTGAGVLLCKKTLDGVKGNFEEALLCLRERMNQSAEKKTDRHAGEGLVKFHITEDKKTAALVEVNCETDFVAMNKSFSDFVEMLALQVAMGDYKDLEDLLASDYVLEGEGPVSQYLMALSGKLGERILVRRIKKLESQTGFIMGYDHGKGRIGTLVCLEGRPDEDVGMEVAMHIAALKPQVVARQDLDPALVRDLQATWTQETQQAGKPARIIDKIVSGKTIKYYSQVCLLDQKWIKDDQVTMADYLVASGSGLRVQSFLRYETGDGLERKTEVQS